jgi:excinuclease ABC subunit B
MKFAIEETERRRGYQLDYNKRNNITPKSIEKEIRGRLVEEENKEEVDLEVEKLDEKQKKFLIKEMEQKMLIAADNLDFEKAAQLRDKMKEIKLSIS